MGDDTIQFEVIADDPPWLVNRDRDEPVDLGFEEWPVAPFCRKFRVFRRKP